MISWEIFDLDESFQGTCSSHAFSKTCQYGTTKEFFCKNLKYVSITFVQLDLQKCKTWPKKSRKCTEEWNKTCMDSEICPRKLNILVKTR